MSTTPPNVLQLARQGDPDAIAALMNRHLQAQGITAHILQQQNRLQVSLESAHVPNQSDLVAYVSKGIIGLKLAAIHHLTVSSKQVGAEATAWSEDLRLQDTPAPAEIDPGAIADTTPVDTELDFDLSSTDGDAIDLSDLDAIDLDLGEDLSAVNSTDLDLGDSSLDLSDASAGSNSAADFFDLDLALTDSAGDGGNELDFDLGELDDPSQTTAADDLDLGLVDTTPPDPANADDFNLIFDDEPNAAPAATDLDFDLGLPEAAEDVAELDLNLGGESADLADFDLDLNFDDQSEVSPATDLDFDLGLPEAPEATADLDLNLADESTDLADFDLNFDADDPPVEDGLDLSSLESPGDRITASDDDLDFDLNFDDESSAVTSSADLDFDLADAPATDVGDLDFDLGLADVPDASGDVAPMADLTGDDLDLEQAAGSDTDLDFDLGLDEAGLEGLDTAAAELDLDFDADAGLVPGDSLGADDLGADDLGLDSAAPQASDLSDELDDLWDEADAGLTVEPADSPVEAWTADAELPAMDDLIADGNDSIDAELGLIDDPGPDVEGLDASGLDISGLDASELDATAAALDLEAEVVDLTAEVDALAMDAAPPDLSVEAGLAAAGLDPNLDDLPGLEEMGGQEAENIVFEDLGAGAALDQAELDAMTTDSWTAEPDLSLGEAVDLAAEAVDDGAIDAIDPEFAAANLPDISPDTSPDTSFEPPSTDDWDSAVNSEELSPALDAEMPEFDAMAGIDGGEAATWDMPAEGFDPNLVLETPVAFDADLGPEFDPELAVDTAAPPNPFDGDIDFPGDEAVDSLPAIEAVELEPEAATPFSGVDFDQGDDFDAEPDMSFSTMELDQTAAGDNMAVDGFTADSGQLDDNNDDAAFESVEIDFGAVDSDRVALDLDNESEDLAFESVEFAADELNDPEFEAVRFSDDGLVADDAIGADFGDNVFDDDGFENGGFDADAFSDSSGESANGLMPDRNGAAFLDDESDATDDFLQELAADPSTHVSLSPGQFGADGSENRSSLPLWLLVGLGAVVLALAGLLLNGLLGRLRQPGDVPAVTEPAPDAGTPPIDPAAVPEADLFRQAVNAAQTAADQAQTANTSAEWQNVASSWAGAIELMQRVPESDPNYAVAQQKVVDYQPNLNYARQNAEGLQ